MKQQQILFRLLPLMGFLMVVLGSCSDDFVSSKPAETADVDDSNLVETRLSLNVAAMNAVVETRADADDVLGPITEEEKLGTEAERKIDNIWVFQFDAATQKLLITPRYYDISRKVATEDGLEAEVLLKPDVASIVYVVANIGSDTWATVAKSPTLSAVKELVVPNPRYIPVKIGETPTDLSLPMEGGTESVIPSKGMVIEVPVTRMYAKMEILVENIPETLVLTDVNVSQIPYYCRVGTLASADPMQAAAYPIGHNDWNSFAFNPGTKNSQGKYTGKMVIYLPENLQGRTTNTEADAARKTEDVPNDNALRVDFVANYVDIFTGEEKERGRHYPVYPGANNYNDYNIKRNFIYRVKLNIYTDLYDQDTPSSNCFVVKPGQRISFLPYYRTETGGGHVFTNYLDANSEDASKKINDSKNMLDNIKIIWQTKDAIGDNSNGDLVWVDSREEASDEFHRKIHVRAGKRGNALIAAYNSSGEIIWSWHIWVTENDPANISSAVVYSTYAWNENGVITSVRVPGYAIMPCNLGALKYFPDGDNDGGDYVDKKAPETHGMLYQWGRKDPFPPSRLTRGDAINYDNISTGYHYANDNEEVVGKTSGTDESLLFHSALMPGIRNREIAFSVKNPTVFICGTKEAHQGETYVSNRDNYLARGDWQYNHHETLWGGLAPDPDGNMKMYYIGKMDDTGNPVHIIDNYGDKKSIYDPCPSGWRVPPGDLWLGFTRTGLNPNGNYSLINTSTPVGTSMAGMYMYVNGWKEGERIFFPTQGTRVADGRLIRSGSCGNYHNATTDATNGSQRVNILHVHNDGGLFRVFELGFYMYYVKSVAGPIRCVRDHK